MQTCLARRASDARTSRPPAARVAARAITGAGATSTLATSREATLRRRPAVARSRRRVALLLLALAAVLSAAAFAQQGPVVTLNGNVLHTGDTVALDASALRPSTDYAVVITAPDGSSQRQAVRSDASGSLHFEHVLDRAGDWTLRLSGPGIDAPFQVQVSQQSNQQPNGTAAPAPTSPPATTPSTPSPSAPATPTPSPSTPTPSQPDTTTPATPATPAAPQPPGTASVAPILSIDGGSLVATLDGAEAWRLDFPADSGDTAGAVLAGGHIYLGHGNSVLVIDPTDGRVAARYPLPAQVVAIEASDSGAKATVAFQSGARQTLEVNASGTLGTVRFGTDPAMFGWLRHEADVADPAQRLRQDPTNPWLYVAVAKLASDTASADAAYQQALDHATTFYDRAQLAQVLYAAGRNDLANRAMDASLRDYVERGYTAGLLGDATLRDAYGFPLGTFQRDVANGELQAAAFWAPWVYRLSSPEVPATQAALLDYSRALRADGQRSEASLWRARAHEGGGFRLGRALGRAAQALGHAGWYGVAALLLAMLFLHFTLVAKYWRPQSLALKQRREGGSSTGRVPRLFAIRYYSFTEKLVLVLTFAVVLALSSLAGWATRGDRLPTAWRSGTLASVPARDALATALRPGPVSDFVTGYAAQVAGDAAAATQAYQAAGDFAPALNNLGALKGEDALYQQALDVAADLPEALFNLGRGTDPSRLHAAYAKTAPLLVAPSDTQLRAAVAGSFQDALASAFTNPWSELTGFVPLAVPGWVWDVLVVLFLAWAAVTIVSLVVPRARLARNAPRTAVYHLLALLIPGSGLADELWGVLLLVPWAIFGLDALLHLLTLGAPPTMPLATDTTALIVIYVLNVVSFFVEFASYRRRMNDLKRTHPDTARAYGMRVPERAAE